MPIAPRLTPHVTAAPFPRVRRHSTLTPLAAGVGVAQAQERFGAAVEGAGLQVASATARLRAAQYQAEKEAYDKGNRAAIVEMQNQADAWRLEHLYKADTGYLSRLGEHARGVIKDAEHELRTFEGEVFTGLPNDERRLAWKKIFGDLRGRTLEEVLRHSDRQLLLVEKDQLDAKVELSVSMASAAANDPERIAIELGKGLVAIEMMRANLGMSAEESQLRKAALTSAVHVGVINNLLATKQTTKANIYFEHARDEINGAQLDEVITKLRANTADVEGERAADAIWLELGPKNDTEAISLDVMERRARTLFGDDTDSYKATVSALRMRKQATDDGRRERNAAREGAVWSQVLAGTPFPVIRQMREFTDSPEIQLKVRDYLTRQQEHAENVAAAREGRAAARESRAWTAQQRAEKQREQSGWARYWELSDPSRLSALKDGEVLALTPELGQDHVNRLMTAKREAAKNPEKARAAAIDEQLFNTIAQEAGLQPYAANTTDQKATLGQLKNAVETAIDREQTGKGRELSRTEKQALMQGIVDQRVMLDTWGGDEAAIAATVVSPDDQAVAYVPLAQIPAQSLQEWVNVIRSSFPSAARLTDEQIVRGYTARIQRAHAAHVLRLGPAAERQRLEGR